MRKLALISGLLFAVLLGGGYLLVRAGRWYQGLVLPRSVKPEMGATVWSLPAGAVGASMEGPAEPPMPRNDAARLLRNPQPATPTSVERGNAAYATYCSACHGAQGRGDGPVAAKLLVRPPDLPSTVGRRTDGFLYATIRNGGALMPPLGSRIPPAERWDLVNFLRSIATTAPDQSISQAPAAPVPASIPRTAEMETKEETQGDVARGRQVFEANCRLCHSAETEEIIVGPGLKGLFHWPPHALSDGAEHKEHSVDVIRKQIREGGGNMAPVGAAFSDQEMADLIAYLQTL